MTQIFFYSVLFLSVGLNIFLTKEHIQKFRYWEQFRLRHTHKGWHYPGDQSPGTYTITLSGKTPFHALIGFHLIIPGIKETLYDTYGYVTSDADHTARFSTYLHDTPVDFSFLIDGGKVEDIKISITPGVAPTDYPPHFWQKWGFF